MRIGFVFLSLILLTACSSENRASLMNIRSEGSGPDEFSITTYKPLVIPQNLRKTPLPKPSKVTQNRADLIPENLLLEALGANSSKGLNDQNFIKATSRFGNDPKIREKLAKEDEELRQRKRPRILERIARSNVYFRIYSEQSLAANEELSRLRRLGVITPSAPPASK